MKMHAFLFLVLSAMMACEESKRSRQDTTTPGENSQNEDANEQVSPSLNKIDLETSAQKIPKGVNFSVAAFGTYSDQNKKNISADVNWTTSDNTIVDFLGSQQTGKARTLRAKAVGSSKITVTFENLKAELVVEVSAAELVSVRLLPINPSMPAGGNGTQFQLLALLSDQSEVDLASSAEWELSDDVSNAVQLNNSTQKGFAQGAYSGSANVKATLQGKSASTTLTITDAVLQELSFGTCLTMPVYPGCVSASSGACPVPSSPVRIVGGHEDLQSGSLQIHGYFSDCSFRPITDVANLQFTSSHPAVAAFSPTILGRLAFLSSGSTQISAQYQSKSTVNNQTINVGVLTTIALHFRGDPPPPEANDCGTWAAFPEPALQVNQLPLQVHGLKNNCDISEYTANVQWSSSDPAVASFSTTTPGLLLFHQNGEIDVTASYVNEVGATISKTKHFTIVHVAVDPGVSVAGSLALWYASSANQSCKAACEALSPPKAYSNETHIFAGPTAKGGSAAKCKLVLDALGLGTAGAAVQMTSSITNNGCHYNSATNVRMWDNYGEHYSAKGGTFIRACACQ